MKNNKRITSVLIVLGSLILVSVCIIIVFTIRKHNASLKGMEAESTKVVRLDIPSGQEDDFEKMEEKIEEKEKDSAVTSDRAKDKDGMLRSDNPSEDKVEKKPEMKEVVSEKTKVEDVPLIIIESQPSNNQTNPVQYNGSSADANEGDGVIELPFVPYEEIVNHQ